MLTDFIESIAKNPPQTADELENLKRQFLRSNKNFGHIPTKKELLKVYHILLKKNKIKKIALWKKYLSKER